MKKILLPLFLSACAFSGTAQVNNGGFERWNKVLLFEHPLTTSTTMSSNYDTYFDTGELGVFAVQHDGSTVLHVENLQGTTEVYPGYFLFGKLPDENNTFGGGFPVSDGQISGISMDLNYAIAEGSEGSVFIQFKSEGIPVGEGNFGAGTYVYPLSGIQDWTHVEFNFDAPIGAAVDECVIGFTSANTISGDSPFEVGSFLEVDNLKFIGSEDPIPGWDFEIWSDVKPVMVPDACVVNIEAFTANFMKSVDEFEGNYAVKLVTQLEANQIEVGHLLMGDMIDGEVVPNIHLNEDASTVSFRYYYQGVNDQAEAHITLYQKDGESYIPILEKTFILESNETYSAVEYNFLEDLQANLTTADFMSIEFKSSADNPVNTPQAGSFLLLDAVQLSGPTGFELSMTPRSYLKSVRAYPNPTIGRVQFRFHGYRTGYFRVFNSNGMPIDVGQFSHTRTMMYNLYDLPAGTYLFKFHHNSGNPLVRVIRQ